VVRMVPGVSARAVDGLLRRLRGIPKPRNKIFVERGLRTPSRDGFALLGDLYGPAEPGDGGATILIRTPYGRGAPLDALWGRTLAAQGYHVLLQSCRGTAGSTDTFQPMVREAADAQDTVVWLREQPWFNGSLGTIGMSYLAYTEWALLMDPPPELQASVMIAGPHDFSSSIWDSGAFALETYLGWSDANSVAFEDRPSALRQLAGRKRANRLKSAYASLPLAEAASAVLGARAPWYREWLDHPDPAEPYWRDYDFADALERVRTPTLLVGGWYDVFLRQTVVQYETLRSRGIDVALTLGPWTHRGHVLKGSGVIDNEALQWFDTYLGTQASPRRTDPVRTFVTGTSRTWHSAQSWPPASTETSWFVHEGGRLASAAATGGTSTFCFNPADPTPAAGGRRLASGAGVVDNAKLEARSDVLTFTGAALTNDVEFEGAPTVEVTVSVDNPNADLFVRVCEVDTKGRSRNICDGFVRLDPAVPAGEIQDLAVRLLPCAHRVQKGHSLRLQLSGGAHPLYARNLGTGELAPTGASLKTSVRTIYHATTRLVLPVTTPARLR
jgi:putative CocE/NonD family hydrolase